MTKRYVFFIALASFILTVIWIVSNVYHSYATSTIEPALQVQIEEIEPEFDEEVLRGLQDRRPIEPTEEPLFNPLLSEDQIATTDSDLLPPVGDEVLLEPEDIPVTEQEEPIQQDEPIIEEEGEIEG